MAFFDMPLDQLKNYKPDIRKPDGLDAFWQKTLDVARSHPLNAIFSPVEDGLKLVDVFDVTFNGYAGQPVKGWFLAPRKRDVALPCVVEYIGYGGGRGFGFEHLLWPNMGYAYFIMDTRGQGSAWRHGDTADIPDGANPSIPGFMTQGILNPETYYYRRVFTDAVRAIEAAKSHDAVDASQIALTGGSQGGALTIAAGALQPDVQVVMPDVPFLCHFERAISITDNEPFHEIRRYLQIHRDKIETVLNTLSYFDCATLAAKTQATALYSVGLMDLICPPSTVFAAYNNVPSEKEIRVYRYNHHEGGGSHHTLEKIKFLQRVWG